MGKGRRDLRGSLLGTKRGSGRLLRLGRWRWRGSLKRWLLLEWRRLRRRLLELGLLGLVLRRIPGKLRLLRWSLETLLLLKSREAGLLSW